MAARSRSSQKKTPTSGRRPQKLLLGVLAVVLVLLVVGVVGNELGWVDRMLRSGLRDGSDGPPGREDAVSFTLRGDPDQKATLWWDDVPRSIQRRSLAHNGVSNVAKVDYAGPEACRECHKQNYQDWLTHSHRLMNAMATPDNVVGDFSGGATIDYRKVHGSFYRVGDKFYTRLDHDGGFRVFEIARTIGSRFYQYYVGRQIEGPEESYHAIYKTDHVLPFGYWLDEQEWVPIVHVSDEPVDEERDHPWDVDSYLLYDEKCAACHTTEPYGDWLMRPDSLRRVVIHGPRPIHFFASGYLADNHPDIAPDLLFRKTSLEVVSRVGMKVVRLPAVEHAVTLGVSCEACHNGSDFHVRDMEEMPLFFPSSVHLFLSGRGVDEVWGKTSTNLNWVCGRCHSGPRPRFAYGMGTWNSTEFTDATLGNCYEPTKADDAGLPALTCVHCHNPHKGIGKKWMPEPSNDDRKCLDCHGHLVPEDQRRAHTHHPSGTPGSRCMNCHMPRINEGLQDVVRTHTIFSPTDARMIEANHPNACNLCHVDQPIDWTLRYLKEWYDADYDETKIATNYPQREGPVGTGWLYLDHEATRLVGADALSRANARWALPEMIDMLNDPFLLNRQFTQKGIEEMLDISLDAYGYRFYMYADERVAPLERVRKALLEDGGPGR